ncbi:MAG: hypothetical protein WKF58_06255 [Ilumatobacteraceae bacterium]
MLEPLSRFEAEPFQQRPPPDCQRVERLALAIASVEGKGEPFPRALPKRVLGAQSAQRRDHFFMAPECQFGIQLVSCAVEP